LVVTENHWVGSAPSNRHDAEPSGKVSGRASLLEIKRFAPANRGKDNISITIRCERVIENQSPSVVGTRIVVEGKHETPVARLVRVWQPLALASNGVTSPNPPVRAGATSFEGTSVILFGDNNLEANACARWAVWTARPRQP
jgi:hypothetical protein